VNKTIETVKTEGKIIDFLKFKKIFFGISISIFVIGIIFNIIFGTTLDIGFAGGTMLKYSYVGEINLDELEATITDELQNDNLSFANTEDTLNSTADKKAYTITVQFGGTEDVTLQDQLTKKLQEKYADNNFSVAESMSVEGIMGLRFLLKCLAAVGIAGALMVLYVAFRFRRIGGISAGVTALIALVHDVGFIYVVYVVLQMPIDDNFIAVVLTIIGYSLNDTIIIYDRVREERKAFGPKADIKDVFNYSCTKVIKRTVFTSVATLLAIGTVYVVSLIYHLDSVTAFAFPMMLGIICGCYSTIFIAGPVWVLWKKHTEKSGKNKGKKSKIKSKVKVRV
jgi:preprotein translocase subunit SecF